jgi:hypothetical protein
MVEALGHLNGSVMVGFEDTTRRPRRAAWALVLGWALAGCGGSLQGKAPGAGSEGGNGSASPSGSGGGNGSAVTGGGGSGSGSAVTGGGGSGNVGAVTGGGWGGAGAPASVTDGGAGSDAGVPACATPVGAYLVRDASSGPGTCIFALPRPVNFASYDWITVRVHWDAVDASVELPFDANHLDGWDFTDADHASIEIYGPACDAFGTGAISRVVVSYVCLLI